MVDRLLAGLLLEGRLTDLAVGLAEAAVADETRAFLASPGDVSAGGCAVLVVLPSGPTPVLQHGPQAPAGP